MHRGDSVGRRRQRVSEFVSPSPVAFYPSTGGAYARRCSAVSLHQRILCRYHGTSWSSIVSTHFGATSTPWASFPWANRGPGMYRLSYGIASRSFSRSRAGLTCSVFGEREPTCDPKRHAYTILARLWRYRLRDVVKAWFSPPPSRQHDECGWFKRRWQGHRAVPIPAWT